MAGQTVSLMKSSGWQLLGGDATYCLLGRDEELARIRVRASIGHTDSVGLVMLQTAEFVLEFMAPYTLAACAVS